MNDTICAIATSLGVGAISIIRISGKEAIEQVNKIFSKSLLNKQSHTITYGYIISNGVKIDEVLVSVMKSPKTYTGEDIVEINCHGGISTTNKILELLLTNKVRLATPGEFTRRAFLNGKIDLIKAESISDLIKSKTDIARKLAMEGITGSISSLVNNVRSKLVSLMANIEVNIDYPEYDDILVISNDILKPKLNNILKTLNELLKNAENGKIIKEGLSIALIGKPNVGKSSVLNNLLQENKAIVTSIPGTTRDTVEGQISLNGIILNIIDTAGIRKTTDKVEKIGVTKSLEQIKNADLIILILNNNEKITPEEEQIIKKIKNKNHIILVNKNDLTTKIDLEVLSKNNIVFGNTKKPEGLLELKQEIIKQYNLDKLETSDLTYLSNARHISLVKLAIEDIENCLNQITSEMPVDIIAEDLKLCYTHLGEIIGVSYKDDLLDEMFKNFCIGK